MDASKIAIFLSLTGILFNSIVLYILFRYHLFLHSSFLFPTLITLFQFILLSCCFLTAFGQVLGLGLLNTEGFCQFIGFGIILLYAIIIKLHYLEAINPIRVLIYHRQPLSLKQTFIIFIIVGGLSIFIASLPYIMGDRYVLADSDMYCFMDYQSDKLGNRAQVVLAALFILGFPFFYGITLYQIIRELRSLPRINQKARRILVHTELVVFKRSIVLTAAFCISWAYPTFNYVTLMIWPRDLSFSQSFAHEMMSLSSGILVPVTLFLTDKRFHKCIKKELDI